MNERARILKLVQEGRLSVEEADALLEAISAKMSGHADSHPSEPHGRLFSATEEKWSSIKNKLDSLPVDKWQTDLRQLGSQISASIQQSLAEVGRTLQQSEPFQSWSTDVLTTSYEIQLPKTVKTLNAETLHGRIHLNATNEDHIRIEVRGRVKTDDVEAAHTTLIRAVQTRTEGDRCDLFVLHNRRDEETGLKVIGARFDIFMPKGDYHIFARTQNGSVHAFDIEIGSLQAESVNGSIQCHGTHAAKLMLQTDNGRIDIIDSVTLGTKHVYAASTNGKLQVEGIVDSVGITGTARSAVGKIDIDQAEFEVDVDPVSPVRYARFTRRSTGSSNPECRFQLEARNGSIRIRP